MLALVVAILVTVADQYTKAWVRGSMALAESHPIIPGLFNLTYLRNTGAAWGMFSGHNLALTVLSLVMLVLMVVFRRSFLNNSRAHSLALGLLCGGILGNVLDRIRHDWVTDFLDFHVAGHHWPAFNIADSAICVGVGIYVLTSFLAERRGRKALAVPPPAATPAAPAA